MRVDTKPATERVPKITRVIATIRFMTLNNWYSVFQYGSALALFFTFAFGVGTILIGLRLNKEAALELARLKSEAERLKLEAAKAGEHISTLQAETAEANKITAALKREAEKERLERIKLEALIQPRFLDADGQRRLAEACKRFSGRGTRVEITPSVIDPDGRRLATQIGAALRECLGARVTPPVLSMAGEQEGVTISGDSGNQELVSTLVSTLTSMGIVAQRGPDIASVPDRPQSLVAIRIGLKPLQEVPKP